MSKKVYKALLGTIGKALPKSSQPFGRIGKKFRYYCAKNIVEQIGTNVNIEPGAILQESVIIGSNTNIGINCVMSNDVTISSEVMMGQDCLIYTNNHKFDKENLWYDGYTETKPVLIEEYTWIGARCIILPGVTIGKGSTVGAGSVVTKSIPPYSIAAGNPAKVIKSLI